MLSNKLPSNYFSKFFNNLIYKQTTQQTKKFFSEKTEKKNFVLETIQNRRSTRAFKKNQVPKKQIETIINSALLSPSSRNQQPWRAHIVRNEKLLREIGTHIYDELSPQIPRFSERKKKLKVSETVFYDAPTVIFITMDKSRVVTDRSQMDIGIFLGMLINSAQSLKIDSIPIGVILRKQDYIHKKLSFNDNEVLKVALALGYKDPERNIVEKKDFLSEIEWVK
ncbi:nad(p)h nitroreductase ydgi-related [Anaeramoeba ignava]|uniref:Nad(P)h nitroreductase ydgi-related n=1 Tax=Anaeramoeba ignava TaxID=1746090 RepID=A0A9Q0R550_ANAIG|nr:nad(p)h nitroreductase ydgi-related [Anaeramoeba ignava]